MASLGKVLILVENLSVPFDQRVWREANALTEVGYRVNVICPKGSNYDTKSYEILDNISIYRYKAYEANSSFTSYIIEYFQAIIKIIGLSLVVFFKEGFDVIQICNPPDLLFFVALPYKILGRKVIFDHHDLSPETYLTKKATSKRDFIFKILIFFERVTFKTADFVISTNESYKKIAISRGKVSKNNIIVVRNGPDKKRFKIVNGNINNDKKHLILYFGVVSSQDGVDYLLRSIHYLIYELKRNDFHLIIIGGGSALDEMKNYAKELRIYHKVNFTGRIPDYKVIPLLSKADICVSPDPKTALNDISTMNKTLEYMAIGKPIVAYDLKETKISAGDAALYASSNDEKDFAHKILLLMDSPSLRKKLGKIGKRRIFNSLSWEHSKKNLYEAYKIIFKMAGKVVD